MILVYCLLCLGHTFFSGLVILKLWTWFMVPLGLPAIALYHAIGLDMLFAAFKGIQHGKPSEETDREKLFIHSSAVVVASYLHLGICLLLGYLAHILNAIKLVSS